MKSRVDWPQWVFFGIFCLMFCVFLARVAKDRCCCCCYDEPEPTPTLNHVEPMRPGEHSVLVRRYILVQ